MTTTPDPIEAVPEPEEVRRLLAEAVRRTDLLRSMLRLARRKAAYSSPALAGATPCQIEKGGSRNG